MKNDIVLSGIRPTGNLHLGNYYGAVRSFVKMQEEYNCYFFIADWHSLTTHPKPENIQRSARTILAEYLACGIDPEKATIYIQSDVPETIELYLYFNMNAYIGELGRVTTFKEKARQQPDNVNAGLFTYPTLMAADILQHRAKWVPVGKDQEQNMEMARKCARRFNNIYGVEFFPEPQNYYFGGDAIKVPGLDGSGKMGKSDGNCIYLFEDEKVVRKKVMRAVTDNGPQEPNSPKPEVIQNLFTMMSIVSEPETVKYFDEKWNDCTLRYGDMKKQLAEDMVKTLNPIRERIQEFSSDQERLDRIARLGAEKARESAAKTLNEVRQIIGFRKYVKALVFLVGLALGMMIPQMLHAQEGGGVFGFGQYTEQQSREGLLGDPTTMGYFNLHNQQFNDGEGGYNLYNQSFEEVPMGSGLLILTAAGAGYALKKRKSNNKKHKS